MDEKGVYAIARSLWDNPDFAEEEYTQREAWMWLIGAAAWRSMKVRGSGRAPVTLERGEFTFSVRFLAEKWGWSKSRVGRFICMLEKRDMIWDVSRDSSTVFSIKKYNDFQVVGLPKRDTKRDASRDDVGTDVGQQRDKEETLKHSNIETEEQEGASRAVVVVPPPELPAWLDREAWAGYVEMRRKKRAPITPRALALIIKRLEKWRALGHDPTEILDKSTQNAWTDIYEPKGENGQGPRRNKNDSFLQGIGDAVSEANGET